MREIVLSKLTT